MTFSENNVTEIRGDDFSENNVTEIRGETEIGDRWGFGHDLPHQRKILLRRRCTDPVPPNVKLTVQPLGTPATSPRN